MNVKSSRWAFNEKQNAYITLKYIPTALLASTKGENNIFIIEKSVRQLLNQMIKVNSINVTFLTKKVHGLYLSWGNIRQIKILDLSTKMACTLQKYQCLEGERETRAVLYHQRLLGYDSQCKFEILDQILDRETFCERRLEKLVNFEYGPCVDNHLVSMLNFLILIIVVI